jgi:hypothetical protein
MRMTMLFTTRTSLIAAALLTTASLFTAPAAYAQLVNISPLNAAAASNSDDDVVVQSNTANVKQDADVDCEAKISDNDKVRVGDNANTAANACGTTQTSAVVQSNNNEDNDVQVAEATACQALALLGIGANVCDTTIDIDVPDGPPEEDGVWCVTYTVTAGQFTGCFSTQEECEGFSEGITQPPYSGTIDEECEEFEEPPPGSFCAIFEGSIPVQAVPCTDLT